MIFLVKEMSNNKRKKLTIHKRVQGDPNLKFVLFKENIESMQAIHNLSKLVKKQPKYFGIAGNKDKRGITCQFVTITHGNLGNLQRAIVDKNWLKKIRVGHIEQTKDQLKLGSLNGNRFSIALRFITGVTDTEISQNVENIKNNGFINYFGMQRFGSYNIMTHTVGKEVIKENWKDVIRKLFI